MPFLFTSKKQAAFLLSALLIVSASGNVAFSKPTIQSNSTPAQTIAKPVDADSEIDNKTPETKAKIEYNKGVELFQIAQIQSEKGNVTGQKKLLKEAIKHFETALDLNPKLVEAQSNIGFAHLTIHDYSHAIQSFQKALTINPQHLNTLNGLSTAYAFEGKIDDALKTFDRLTTLDPSNSQYFFNKGSVLQKAGRVAAARQAYEQALHIQSNDQRTLFNLGTLFENQGNFTEAQKYYEKAKGVEIGNTIGLEAIHRLEAMQSVSTKP